MLEKYLMFPFRNEHIAMGDREAKSKICYTKIYCSHSPHRNNNFNDVDLHMFNECNI